MSKEEYSNCLDSDDKKSCIDAFWKKLAGSNERAVEILKKYYSRVTEANNRYTSYKEGWKTDRGMIYVIFGEPVNIYKNNSEEIWVYGAETDINSLKFNFAKEKCLFSTNHYVLKRSFSYKEPWYTAVDFWRMGRLYLER